MRHMCLLLGALALAALGCKGKSKDKAPPAGKATPKAGPTAVTGDAAAACMVALGNTGDQRIAGAIKACKTMCPDIGGYAAIKKAARPGVAKKLRLGSDALLTELSYVFMTAGRCFKMWKTTASDADRQRLSKMAASAKLDLAMAARGYYRLAKSTSATAVADNDLKIMVTPGHIGILAPMFIKLTGDGGSLIGTFPGKTATLHQLSEQVSNHKGVPVLIAHEELPLVRIARVLHGLKRPARLAVAKDGKLAAHTIELRASPAGVADAQFIEWKQLEEAVATGKRPKTIHMRIDRQNTRVGALIKLTEKLPVMAKDVIHFGNPSDPNTAAAGGTAHVKLGIIQAVGAKPGIARKAVTGIMPQLRKCYATALASKPNIKGPLVAILRGDASGEVNTSRAKGVDKAVSACVAAALKKLRFGKLASAKFRVTVQLRFSAKAARNK